MPRIYVFGDESGNFDFSLKPGASRYFMIGTIALRDPSVGNDLLSVRRELAYRGIGLQSPFHAAEDTQAVRDAVFAAITPMDVRVDLTILEKRKTQDHLRANPDRFYKQAWYLHFKYVCPQVVNKDDDLLVVASSLGTRSKWGALRGAIHDVVQQSATCRSWKTAFWPCGSDPCLVMADYFTWAVQRRYERADPRSYDLIRPQIRSEFQPFRVGTKTYY
jgi:hypothetical protein